MAESFFPLVLKRAVRETLNLRPSNAEVKNEWRYTSTPPIHSWYVQELFCPLIYRPRAPTNNALDPKLNETKATW